MPFLHFNETNLKTNLLLNTEVIYIYMCMCVCVCVCVKYIHLRLFSGIKKKWPPSLFISISKDKAQCLTSTAKA